MSQNSDEYYKSCAVKSIGSQHPNLNLSPYTQDPSKNKKGKLLLQSRKCTLLAVYSDQC